MKKILCSLLLVFGCVLFPTTIHAEVVDLVPTAQAAFLMDYESGTILFEKNADECLYPASMTKMMSLLLVLKQLHTGAIQWVALRFICNPMKS